MFGMGGGMFSDLMENSANNGQDNSQKQQYGGLNNAHHKNQLMQSPIDSLGRLRGLLSMIQPQERQQLPTIDLAGLLSSSAYGPRR